MPTTPHPQEVGRGSRDAEASRTTLTIDGNEAAARIAHLTNEVIAIYPITPSSRWANGRMNGRRRALKNLWGTVPQSSRCRVEGGAAGAIHGALQTGALATTFTASQGLLLMIPNMYKIAGELTPFVMHVAARSLAAQALSIFGDHSDVMASRADRFRHARLQFAAGSDGPGADRAGGHAGRTRAYPAFLRRFPHLPRGGQDRAVDATKPCAQ